MSDVNVSCSDRMTKGRQTDRQLKSTYAPAYTFMAAFREQSYLVEGKLTFVQVASGAEFKQCQVRQV